MTKLRALGNYAAIRHSDDGHDWIDVGTISGDRQVTKDITTRKNKQIPGWASANPMVRIGRVDIIEV